MKTNISSYQISNNYLDTLDNSSSILFLDIETTGFSRQTSLVYMIGFGFYDSSSFHITQLLIENKEDEKELLTTFFLVASSFEYLLTFNGIQFDLPFLIERGKIHDLDGTFIKNKNQIDLFREFKSLRHILSLENTRQKTLEDFLKIQRDDQYNGGQLIPIFYDYLDQPSIETEQLLWTHNREDVVGMYQLLPLFSYQKILNTDEPVHTTYQYLPLSNELFIIQETKISVPIPISYRFKHYYLSLENNKRKLLISLVEKDYRLPLSPIKDYVYVKSEDMVIPKALASTMDKDNYCKATTDNCFLRVPANCFGLMMKNNVRLSPFSLTPLTSDEKKDLHTYFSITELLAYSNKNQLFNAIFSTVLEELLTKK